VDGQLGLEKIPDCLGWATGDACGECYVCHLVEVFRGVWRVLRPDGTLWLNLGDSSIGARCGGQGPGGQLAGRSISKERANVTPEKRAPGLKPKDLVGIPWRVALALQRDGWWLRSDVIWDKPTPMPESVYDRPSRSHEHLFLLTKIRRPYFYDYAAVLEPASVNSHPRGKGVHPKAMNAGENVRSNVRYSAAITDVTTVRNKRDVWRVYSEPYKEAHFATFPPALIEPCIKAGTSERGVCSSCGNPWRRRTRTTEVTDGRRNPSPRALINGAVRDNWTSPGGGRLITVKTLGWYSTCDFKVAGLNSCSERIPATVLDPFAGAGTTGLVADRLGRDAILIELNEGYCEMTRRRIIDEAPLFAEVTP
jgi:DNA modification methylase